MTKDDFIQLRKALGRESPRLDSMTAIGFSIAAILGIPVSLYAPERAGFAYIAALLVSCIAYLIYSSRWAKGTGLLCHTCNRPMLKSAADSAIATGTCPHCKRPAFARQA